VRKYGGEWTAYSGEPGVIVTVEPALLNGDGTVVVRVRSRATRTTTHFLRAPHEVWVRVALRSVTPGGVMVEQVGSAASANFASREDEFHFRVPALLETLEVSVELPKLGHAATSGPLKARQ